VSGIFSLLAICSCGGGVLSIFGMETSEAFHVVEGYLSTLG
jgi:hypothetical protein